MADAVTSQTLCESAGYITMLFTNRSDGTGEAAVVKVDVSGLTPACTTVVVEKIIYAVSGCDLTLAWDATTDVPFCVLGGPAAGVSGVIDASEFGGIHNNAAAANLTGDIVFTLTGAIAAAGNSYTVILYMRKVI
jgi:hypothetical protein